MFGAWYMWRNIDKRIIRTRSFSEDTCTCVLWQQRYHLLSHNLGLHDITKHIVKEKIKTSIIYISCVPSALCVAFTSFLLPIASYQMKLAWNFFKAVCTQFTQTIQRNTKIQSPHSLYSTTKLHLPKNINRWFHHPSD